VKGLASPGANRHYALLNDSVVRETVLAGAGKRYGYPPTKIEVRLYVGRFAGRKAGQHKADIEAWAASQVMGGAPLKVVGIDAVVTAVLESARSTQYRDNPTLVALKVLEEAGLLSKTAEAAVDPT
jgi:hypothetical protein